MRKIINTEYKYYLVETIQPKGGYKLTKIWHPNNEIDLSGLINKTILIKIKHNADIIIIAELGDNLYSSKKHFILKKIEINNILYDNINADIIIDDKIFNNKSIKRFNITYGDSLEDLVEILKTKYYKLQVLLYNDCIKLRIENPMKHKDFFALVTTGESTIQTEINVYKFLKIIN